MDVVCIALGGLGSSFDQLAMNRELLVKHNVRLRGVILNKVNPSKIDMIQVRTRLLQHPLPVQNRWRLTR